MVRQRDSRRVGAIVMSRGVEVAPVAQMSLGRLGSQCGARRYLHLPLCCSSALAGLRLRPASSAPRTRPLPCPRRGQRTFRSLCTRTACPSGRRDVTCLVANPREARCRSRQRPAGRSCVSCTRSHRCLRARSVRTSRSDPSRRVSPAGCAASVSAPPFRSAGVARSLGGGGCAPSSRVSLEADAAVASL
jgi:hypothetical protein